MKTAPKQVVNVFLERVARYCQLNGLNPMVRTPHFITERYHMMISSYERVALLDLIGWVRTALIECDELMGFWVVRKQ